MLDRLGNANISDSPIAAHVHMHMPIVSCFLLNFILSPFETFNHLSNYCAIMKNPPPCSPQLSLACSVALTFRRAVCHGGWRPKWRVLATSRIVRRRDSCRRRGGDPGESRGRCAPGHRLEVCGRRRRHLEASYSSQVLDAFSRWPSHTPQAAARLASRRAFRAAALAASSCRATCSPVPK